MLPTLGARLCVFRVATLLVTLQIIIALSKIFDDLVIVFITWCESCYMFAPRDFDWLLGVVKHLDVGSLPGPSSFHLPYQVLTCASNRAPSSGMLCIDGAVVVSVLWVWFIVCLVVELSPCLRAHWQESLNEVATGAHRDCCQRVGFRDLNTAQIYFCVPWKCFQGTALPWSQIPTTF
jgi:hypothetical protein